MALRERLQRRKKKIEMLLPVSGQARGDVLRRQLQKINAMLDDPGHLSLGEVESENKNIWGASGVDGIGGLEFEVNAPPGLGRLIRIPFLFRSAPPFVPNGTVVTDAGQVNNPAAIANASTLIIFSAQSGRSIGGLVFETSVLPWATLRVVGFQMTERHQPTLVTTADNVRVAAPRPFVCVKNFMVSGGANLFSMEGYQDVVVYSASIPEMAGLRAYPIVRSPNFMRVELAVNGLMTPDTGGVIAFGSVNVGLNAVAEVLDDDEYGRHIPGPYARINAMARTMNHEGDTFVLS